MSLFVVDPEKCALDGVCVDECPAYIIQLADSDAVPSPIDGADELCINCGHCVAFCPHGALTLKTMSPADCAEVQPDLLPSAPSLEHLMRARRSVRTFLDKPVPREVLERLVDVARYAPTGSNRQPVEWTVVHDSGVVRHLAALVVEWQRQQPNEAAHRALDRAAERGLDRICRGAPHVVVAHARRGEEANGVIAMSFLELAAYTLGLGACWGGYLNGAANSLPSVRQALGLPDDHVSCGVMLIGYPKYEYRRLPLRNKAKIAWL
jgi:nitroreductase/Pyruvate/2-oxoacid:ferredoxin oxidoreductase delta subunit